VQFGKKSSDTLALVLRDESLCKVRTDECDTGIGSQKSRSEPAVDGNRTQNHVPLHPFSPAMPLLNIPPHAIQTSQFTFEQRSHRACVDQGERTLIPSSLAGGTLQRKQMQTDGIDVSAEVC
jgi:hypothetical protein